MSFPEFPTSLIDKKLTSTITQEEGVKLSQAISTAHETALERAAVLGFNPADEIEILTFLGLISPWIPYFPGPNPDEAILCNIHYKFKQRGCPAIFALHEFISHQLQGKYKRDITINFLVDKIPHVTVSMQKIQKGNFDKLVRLVRSNPGIEIVAKIGKPIVKGNYVMSSICIFDEYKEKFENQNDQQVQFGSECAHPLSKRYFPPWLKFVTAEAHVSKADMIRAKFRNILQNGSPNSGECYFPHVTLAHYSGPPLNKEMTITLQKEIDDRYEKLPSYFVVLEGIDIQLAEQSNGSVIKDSIV